VADEELVPDSGNEALNLAPDTGAEAPEEHEVPEPIINLASELGWVPKDQYRGDPDKWKPADQFIRDGRDIQQSTARELRSMREQMDRMSGVTSQLITDKVAERDAYWKTQFNQAVEEGDTDKANRLLEQRPVAQAQPGGLPAETQAWIAKNEWYSKDPLAQARAIEICERLKHLPIAEQLAQAERGIRKEFPEHFPAPAKQPPATQTGMSRKAAPSNRARGFADMPADSQTMARDMVRRNPGLTLEAIAKSYWSQETQRGVSR
jgi:hypothetical protein